MASPFPAPPGASMAGIDPSSLPPQLLALLQKMGLQTPPVGSTPGGPGVPPPPVAPGMPPAPGTPPPPGVTPGMPPGTVGDPTMSPNGPGPKPPGGGGPPGMAPDMQIANMALGQSMYGPKERALDTQMKQASALRDAKINMKAASPFEQLDTAIGNVMGDRQQKDLMKEGGAYDSMLQERIKKLRESIGSTQGNPGAVIPSMKDDDPLGLLSAG